MLYVSCCVVCVVQVKRSMKIYSNTAKDDTLRRVLDARQLALKLIANVTYGRKHVSVVEYI